MEKRSELNGKLIGITGGVGSGKSTVLQYIKDEYGCEILLADDIGAELQKKGKECYEPMISLFGEEVVGEDGELKRAEIAGKVFENETLRKEINAIIHPAVRREIERIRDAVFAMFPAQTIFIESALFIEAGYLDMLDELWVVTSGEQIRENRLTLSRGYSSERIHSVMNAQLDDDEFKKHADKVIVNNGSKEELYRQTDRLMAEPVFGLDIGTRSVVGTVGYLKGGFFYVLAQDVKEHDTRAMLDGQIHDIARVSETILEVKKHLEAQTGISLRKVCIAAAGRVLKTIKSHADLSFDFDVVITGENIYELESLALENAYHDFEKSIGADLTEKYYLVGHTVTGQKLNNNPIGNLENQRGHLIGMDVIATFLPEDVVEGLYKAVELSGLTVSNLTLEPIAASMVAIPEKFRMLNIALVDVGAGTSDISITDEGSIKAYGMIPHAGDALTEIIAKHCLVDFVTAEDIKKSISVLEEVTYEDIMGIVQTITRKEVLTLLSPMIHQITKEVADMIIALNGGKSVSAIFVVGGGGLVEGYTEALAEYMNISVSRVALRGEEVLSRFIFDNENMKHDSLMVTPLGICLNYYEQNNNFIYVTINGERSKLYNNGNLRVADALMQMNVQSDRIFPKRGKALRFTVNGQIRVRKGEYGDAAIVSVNGNDASVHSLIRKNDIVEIIYSTTGKDAKCRISELAEYKKIADGPVLITVNKHPETPAYEIMNSDIISLESLTGENAENYEEYDADYTEPTYDELPEGYEENEFVDVSEFENLPSDDEDELPVKSEPIYERKKDLISGVKNCTVTVNGRGITLSGKKSYIFVDIFDYIDFDLKNPKGKKIVTKVNGVSVANYMQEIEEGAVIDVHWEN